MGSIGFRFKRFKRTVNDRDIDLLNAFGRFPTSSSIGMLVRSVSDCWLERNLFRLFRGA